MHVCVMHVLICIIYRINSLGHRVYRHAHMYKYACVYTHTHTCTAHTYIHVLQHIATRCNTLQHTATICNSMSSTREIKIGYRHGLYIWVTNYTLESRTLCLIVATYWHELTRRRLSSVSANSQTYSSWLIHMVRDPYIVHESWID